MRNRFNLNESEKNRIRGLHNINPIYEQFSGSRWPSGAEESFNIDKLTDEEGIETVTLSRKDDVINDEGCYIVFIKTSEGNKNDRRWTYSLLLRTWGVCLF